MTIEELKNINGLLQHASMKVSLGKSIVLHMMLII